MLCEKLSRENIDLGLISVGIISIGLISFEAILLNMPRIMNALIWSVYA